MAARMPDIPVMGIDLGTTNSCIAVWENGGPVVLPNKFKENTTPSCVAFTSNGVIVGNNALSQQTENPTNTIYEVKRMIGQTYEKVSTMKYLPFILSNDSTGIKYNVTLESEARQFSPEEISGLILKELKESAEAHIKQEVANVVITVPAYFNETQRESTKVAGTIAGFNVLKVISEPVAAALAFGCTTVLDEERNILVYDLGGGTFDIAVVSISSEGMYHVRATNGNTRLGGSKFDDCLMNFCIEKLADKMIDTTFKNEELCFIRNACEEAKKRLSTLDNTEIVLDGTTITINRDQYDQMIIPYVDTTMTCVRNALKDAELEKDEINEVVLVGGGTFTPLIRKTLEEFFGKSVNTHVNPMEAVGYGACVMAAVLQRKPRAPSIYVRNVTPLSIGIFCATKKKCVPIIKRNTSYPTEKKIQGRTNRDNQKRVKILLTEGEQSDVNGNRILGTLFLKGLTASAKGEETVDVSIKINKEGIISVTATDERTKKQAQINIEKPQRFTQEEILRMTNLVEECNKGTVMEVAKNDFKLDLKLKESAELTNKRIKLEMDSKDDDDQVCPIYGVCDGIPEVVGVNQINLEE